MHDLVTHHIESSSLVPDDRLMEGSILYLNEERSPHETKCSDPIDYLKKIMAERKLCNKDLKAYIGSSGNVCSVLKKRKPLSLRMIRNLHRYLNIPAEILIQPYDCH